MTELNIAEIPFPSGEIRFRYSRIMFPDGTKWIRHGLFRAFHENGALASEGNYDNGLENGPWRDYHSNGRLAAAGQYENGAQVGEWQYWDSDGSQGEG